MYFVGDCRDQAQQEISGDGGGSLLVQFDKGELRGVVDSNEHAQLALFGAYPGNVNVKVADRVPPELPLRRSVALDIKQTANAMALQAAVQ